jgi:hypothetical protein
MKYRRTKVPTGRITPENDAAVAAPGYYSAGTQAKLNKSVFIALPSQAS